MKEGGILETTYYAGLKVQVICRMAYCSLISYKGRKIIVDTSELVVAKAMSKAA